MEPYGQLRKNTSVLRQGLSVLSHKFAAQLVCLSPTRLSYYSGRLGYRVLTLKTFHPPRRTGAGRSSNCFKIPPIPIGLAIRMMARVAGRSDRMSEGTTERNLISRTSDSGHGFNECYIGMAPE